MESSADSSIGGAGASTGRRPRLAVLAAVLLCSYAIAMETTVVSAAIPTVIRGFGGLSDLSWVFSAYLIAQAVTMPLFGSASDRLGRKGCYLVAAAIFFAGTLACGFAWDMLSLILFRVLQGVGAGGLITVGTAALNDIIPQSSRGKYQALGSAVWGIAAISGPIVGAGIMTMLDWRYIFWINLPVVVVSAVLLGVFYKWRASRDRAAGDSASLPREQDDGDSDGSLALVPSLYLCAALLAAMIALVHGQSLMPWQWGLVAAVGGPAAALLWRSQRLSADPLIPRALLRAPIVTLAVVSAFLCGAIAMGLTVYVPSFAAIVLRADYLTISATVAVMTLTWTFSGIGVGLLMKTGQHRQLANAAAWAVLAGTLGLCQVAHQVHTAWPLLLMSGVLGIGLGACSVVFSVTLQSTVDDTVRGSATSLFYLSRMLGQAIGVALCGGVMAGSDPAARALMQQQSQHATATDPAAAVQAMANAADLAIAMRSEFVLLFAMLAALALLQLLHALLTPSQGSVPAPVHS
jgi:MFS family permease